MPCKDTMITDIVKASPSQTVQEIVNVFESRRFNGVPVVDEEGKLVGMFTMRSFYKNLLPVSARIEGGLSSLDFVSESEHGVAKKLRKLCAMKIGDVMEINPPILNPQTNAWEAVRVMAEKGSPVAVVDPDTHLFVGLITMQSLLGRMQLVLREVEKEEREDASSAQ